MKKILTVIALMMVLLGAAGCSKKSYTKEDLEVLSLIEKLDEIEEDAKEANIEVNYTVEKMKDMYKCVITFGFGEHELKITTYQFSAKTIEESLDTYDGAAMWIFEVDGIGYDHETAEILVNHYYDTMYVD